MFPKEDIKTNILETSTLKVSILESGNIQEIRNGIVRVNTYVGNNLEPSINNIYMRTNNGFSRLIGVGSNSSFQIVKDNDTSYALYKGVFDDVHYHIILRVIENALLFKVFLDKNPKKVVELYYGMDVSINNIYAISSNEAYVSQYIDHKVFSNNYGYVICSRQNSDNNYYLESGSIGVNVSYSVDGFQFFGKNYKETNEPVALSKDHLDNKIYQYEFAYHALQSERISLDSAREFTFYSVYSDSHKDKITKSLFDEDAYKYNELIKLNKIEENYKKLEYLVDYNNVLVSSDFNKNEINELYPKRNLEEVVNGKLYSFFLDDKSHVVFKDKELKLERPSGNIIISQNRFNNDEFDFENVISNTSYIYGLFMSQIVCGNTSFNKLLSNQRNPLNIQKISGLRVFIKHNGVYKILTMPGIFEMGINYFKWFYKIDDDILIFKTFVSLRKSKLEFTFESKLNKKYEFLITNHCVMGEREHENKVHVSKDNNDLIVKFDENSFTHNKYPDLYFKYSIDCDYEYSDDRVFYKDNLSRNENLITFKLINDKFRILVSNGLDNNHLDFNINKNDYLRYFDEFTNGFNITGDEELEPFNYLLYWYTHDALIHYLSPHGLEQYNGAAWGTRDVCQGPAELFLSLSKFDKVRKIILDVYNHQFFEDGDFPQWFMFDKYYNILDLSSHGDIIVWPARLLALYLERTLDFSIFKEEVPFIKRDGIVFSEKYSIFEHLIKEIDLIKKNFIPGTHLSCYGGGDWDDTLQPAHSEYKKSMVSGWTTELTYEMFVRLGNVLKDEFSYLSKELLDMASLLRDDYRKYMIKDGVASGFIRFDNDEVKYICHPNDKESGIKYRLLPQTRGIISGLFNEDETKKALEIIDQYLMFPDGVRLMDATVKYNGGLKTHFNRAETAANFGREIGLQYCHANVRYCEAMTKVKDGNKAFEGMQKINPIIVNELLKNASLRQRNSYFSSSDAAFNTRMEAMKNFGKIKTGNVNVKAGWRVYSSGPGIYIKTFICDLLGINEYKDYYLFDPVLPHYLNDFKLDYKLNNYKVVINYHLNSEKRRITLDGKEIAKDVFKIDKNLLNDGSVIDIYLVNELLNKEIKGCFDYFWHEVNKKGLVSDKIFLTEKTNQASIAAIGFAFSSYVIGVERGFISFDEGLKRVRLTLDTLKKVETFHGLYPHFLNMKTCANDKSEFSTIDTAIMLMGAISAASYFGYKENIYNDVLKLINNVDWDYFVRIVDGKPLINMAYSKYHWKEFNGYCPACWDHYAEQLMIYFLYACKDSSTKEKSLDLYHGFERNRGKYKGDELIHCYSNALFIHQFTHAFIDFRNIISDDNIDWFKNSVDATIANRDYCIDQTWSKTYSENSWGLSAFQGKHGYKVFGAPPFGFPGNSCQMVLDGSVAPYASLSSICFTPKYSLKALEFFNTIPGLNNNYGLTDSYNFDDYDISNCYIGIDKGPTIIMLDNFQNGTIWKYFMNCDITKKALEKLDFKNKK